MGGATPVYNEEHILEVRLVLSTYCPSTLCKISKNLMNQNPEKNAVVTDKWTNWAILTQYLASENFPKKFGFVSFEYLWFLNLMQNINKQKN